MTKQRLLAIFQNYVENDLEGSDTGYIADALLTVADEYEIRELGFGWIIYGEEEEQFAQRNYLIKTLRQTAHNKKEWLPWKTV